MSPDSVKVRVDNRRATVTLTTTLASIEMTKAGFEEVAEFVRNVSRHG